MKITFTEIESKELIKEILVYKGFAEPGEELEVEINTYSDRFIEVTKEVKRELISGSEQ